MKKIVSLSPLNTEVLMMMIRGAGISLPDDIEIINGSALPDAELIETIRDADIILGDYSFTRKITGDMARAAKKAKLIQQPSVGYQNIDVTACAAAGIPVANTAGANTASVAEHTVMAALALLKKLVAAHRSTTAGEWRQMEIGAGELQGKTWGLIGMGRIGRAVAERLVPFGVRMIYFSRSALSAPDEEKFHAAMCGLEDLLKTADIISIHCPLTEKTIGLICEKNIALMKPSSLIINVARGEVIDEAALARALRDRRIGGAALDVFAAEPIGRDNPLLGLEDVNLVLTPHTAGATNEAKFRIITAAVTNMVNVLNGKKPDCVVNGVT